VSKKEDAPPVIKSNFGNDFNYNSETDDESKYETP
jgi:hypothetical protein